MALLELKGITKSFGGLVAVNDFSMRVESGQIAGLIGPNGAGKSTLFNVVSGVFPPTTGSIVFDGEDITGLKPNQIARKGLVRTFQLTTVFPGFTVMDNVLVAFHLNSGMGFWEKLLGDPRRSKKGQRLRERALEILQLVGIEHLKDELAGNLPHGHQRNLEIAIALAVQPKLLMLDEPAAGMNPAETLHLMERVRKLRECGITILVIEHDMKMIMGVCERITVLSFGKKIAEGCGDEIQRHPQVIEAYLGTDHLGDDWDAA